MSGALKATGFFRYMDTVHTSRCERGFSLKAYTRLPKCINWVAYINKFNLLTLGAIMTRCTELLWGAAVTICTGMAGGVLFVSSFALACYYY